MLPVYAYSEDEYVFMATSNGTVKKTPLVDFLDQEQWVNCYRA